MSEIVERPVRRRDRLDVEAVVKRAGPHLRLRDGVGNAVIEPVRIRLRKALVDAEDGLERVFEPEAGRRAAEKRKMPCEQAPDRTSVRLCRSLVAARNAEGFELDALRVEHAEDVMVRDDKELGRIGKWQILRVPCRVGVTMRRKDRQRRDALVEPPRDGTRLGVGWEQSVGMQGHGVSGQLSGVALRGERTSIGERRHAEQPKVQAPHEQRVKDDANRHGARRRAPIGGRIGFARVAPISAP